MTTKEIIKDIYEKAKRLGIASAKMDEKDFYTITIYEDGSLSANFEHYCCGDTDTEGIEIFPEELDGNIEKAVESRLNAKKREEELRLKNEEDKLKKVAIEKEDRERKQYEELKKKFNTQ